MDCQFCNKHFSTNNTLLTHQKTAKYCLKIQAQYREIPEQKINQPTIEELQAIIALKDAEIEKANQKADKYKELLEEAVKNTEKTTVKHITQTFYLVTDEQYNRVFRMFEGENKCEENQIPKLKTESGSDSTSESDSSSESDDNN